MQAVKHRFKEGDKVLVVNFGSLLWVYKDSPEYKVLSFLPVKEYENYVAVDRRPDLVGQTGVIRLASEMQGIPMYSIDGIQGKTAWFFESQLELLGE